ncbi:MAG: hypothetical protein HY842_03495 [Bacteroidetes bacterium]|nr:hypothetical protein [Bacteroidota bacterium]
MEEMLKNYPTKIPSSTVTRNRAIFFKPTFFFDSLEIPLITGIQRFVPGKIFFLVICRAAVSGKENFHQKPSTAKSLTLVPGICISVTLKKQSLLPNEGLIFVN